MKHTPFQDSMSETISQLNLLDSDKMTTSSLIPIENTDGTYATTLDELIHKYAYEFQEKQLCGAIMAFAHTSPSSKWLLCNGAEVSQTDYPDLYQKIQDSWGTASKEGLFVLPNLTDKGRFLRSYIPDTKDANGNTINSGTAIGTIQTDTVQNITGKFTGVSDNYYAGSFEKTAPQPAYMDFGNGKSKDRVNVDFKSKNTTRHDDADETRPVNASVAYYIHI